MIFSPCESLRPPCRPRPSSLTSSSTCGGSTRQLTSIWEARLCFTALFMASWPIRRSSASTSGRSRVVRSSTVTWIGMPDTSLRCLRQPAEARAQALAGPDLGAQGQDGAAYLRHDAADPPAQVQQLVALLLGGRLRGERVDGVAEVGDVLGDAVVHLARPAAALLGRGLVLESGEQQGGVEPDRGGQELLGQPVDALDEAGPRGVEVLGQGAAHHGDELGVGDQGEGEGAALEAHPAVADDLLGQRRGALVGAVALGDQGRQLAVVGDVDRQGDRRDDVADVRQDLPAQADRVQTRRQVLRRR